MKTFLRATRPLFCIGFIVFYSTNVLAQKINKQKPNIVWIVAEDFSPHLGSYGEKMAKTPNLDGLAKESIRYTHAFTTAGVCAPSRSAIITGMYQTSIGTQHMRTLISPQEQKDYPVPRYSAVLPESVRCFSEYMRMAGYYCTNNEKQDYQFEPSPAAWDENGITATWRNRPSGKPFFAVFNFFKTHESQLFPSQDPLSVNPADVTLSPLYPDNEVVRKDVARHLTNTEIMDRQVGELIAELKKDNLYDNTIIFFFGDHGDALPWMKRELYDRGIRIPLIIKMLKGEAGNEISTEMVSAVDFAPTVLSLAGLPVPAHMQGQPFLGNKKARQPRKYIFAARDRMDTEYDRVRVVRDKRFKYVYNYMPEKTNYQEIKFRLSIPMMKEIIILRDAGKLNETQMKWFATKPVEELYDLETDPLELNNLAVDKKYESKLNELRRVFRQWTVETKDLGNIPEKEMIHNWWNGKQEPPIVSEINVNKYKDGIALNSTTPGVSFAYRIINNEIISDHEVLTWDFSSLYARTKNGTRAKAQPVWSIYSGPIKLNPGDKVMIKGYRAGFKEANLEYVFQ